MIAMDRPNVSYARADGTNRHVAEALRLAHEIETLLVEASEDPKVDTYALRIARGLARSLIVELGERPASGPRLTDLDSGSRVA
jgi:hypothetical protein